MIERETTILVVDDDREVREVALTVLETAGYRVIEAVSGDDAHRFLLAHPDLRIDLLFTDVLMPMRRACCAPSCKCCSPRGSPTWCVNTQTRKSANMCCASPIVPPICAARFW